MRTPEPQKPRTQILKLKPQKVVISEKVREKNGCSVLVGLGYEVKTLGKPIPVNCPQCKAFHWAKTTGNTTGVADVLVSHKTRWPGVWTMLETKRTGGPKREAQIDLFEDGLSTFVVTEEDFVRAVIAAEERMGIEVNPRLINWLEVNRKG